MPLDTVLCLDTSASMGFNNNEGINQLKTAARKFLEGVQETAGQDNLKVKQKKKFSMASLNSCDCIRFIFAEPYECMIYLHIFVCVEGGER